MPGFIKSMLKETAAVALAAASMLFLVTYAGPLWRQTFAPPGSRLGSISTIKLGSKPRIGGVALGDRRHRTLLLITNANCHFCKESEQFHKNAISMARGRGLAVLVAVPNVGQQSEYLQELTGVASEHLNWKDLDMGAVGTPTVVLIDARGVVTNVDVGRLDGKREQALLDAINGNSLSIVPGTGKELRTSEELSSLPDAALISNRELAVMERAEPVILLDASEREAYEERHRQEATNIPVLELTSRADFELPHTNVIAFVCSNLDEPTCLFAAQELSRRGYRTRVLSDFGYVRTCDMTPTKTLSSSNVSISR
jgi:hypothetical protein